ncbi:phosphotransferase family protein [Ilumatobacter nonamiensis]|uniref:phosphotransferase family protein n=1 Tax=Ilumatobacter nonamiensis TaxID=467093 RepID=UPI000349F8E0|nr:phosphotransferase family protein [Ilumatobacter nonamiensis]
MSITGIDVERVTDWLNRHVDSITGPYEFDQITGGRSNLTFRVTDSAGTAFVLRRPPTGNVLASAHDMVREHRIISAVGQTNVPVPRTLGVCTDDEVNGSPFYVMSYVDGVVLDSAEKAAPMSIENRRRAGEHLIDVMADLHDVDIDEIGLGDLAKREGYVERQVRRWTTQWEKSKTRELPAIDEVGRRLAADLPTQDGVSIAHGDFRFGNALVDIDTGSVKAVLDWELCTLGDPLADVGYLGVYWADPGEAQSRPNDPTGIDGFPTYQELLDRYAARTGRDLSNIGYYVAFSSWRLAVISEGVYARYLHGAMGDQEIDEETMNAFKVGTERLASQALEALSAR